jgi:hypothetical protein
MFGNRNFNVYTHRSNSNPVFGILRPNEVAPSLTNMKQENGDNQFQIPSKFNKHLKNNKYFKNGKDGRDGRDGRDGINGRDGTDGKDGINGVDGVNGFDGINGIDGKDGLRGTQIYSGEGCPTFDIGEVGDYYVDLLEKNVYGPKNEYGWNPPLFNPKKVVTKSLQLQSESTNHNIVLDTSVPSSSIYKIGELQSETSISGIQGGVDGGEILILNNSGKTVTFLDENDGSEENNRFHLGDMNYVIVPNGMIRLIYFTDLTIGEKKNQSRWINSV